MNAQSMMTQDDETNEDFQDAVVTLHPMADRSQNLRIVEAMLFAAAEPLSIDAFKEFLPAGTDIAAILADLTENYINRGVNIVNVAGKFALSFLRWQPACPSGTFENSPAF